MKDPRIEEKPQKTSIYIETCASGFIPRASKEPKVSAKASRTDATGSSRACQKQ
jgi:hypothetical protein